METDYILDDNWINNFEQTDKLYEDFYKDDIYYINLRVIYINRDNEIDKIKQETFLMSKPNTILQDEIIGLLKKNSFDNNKRYSLLSILKYNIFLEPEDVKLYLNNTVEDKFLSVTKNINTITFDKSINMFHDLNDLILIFYEKILEPKRTIDNNNTNNNTKKIYIHSLNSRKKTIRKQYKN